MANSVQPHRRQPTRLPRSWDSPGKNTGVGCHFLLQCMKVKSESEVAQSHTARWRQHSRFTVDLENPWRPEPHFPESPGGWHPCLWPQFPHLGSGLTVSTWQSPREVREAPANSQCHLPLLPTPSTQIKGSDTPGPHSHNKGPPGGHWWHEATCPLPLSDGHVGEKGSEEGRGQRAGPGGHRAGAAGLECPWGSMQGRLRMPPRQELGWILRVAGGHCGCGAVSPGS